MPLNDTSSRRRFLKAAGACSMVAGFSLLSHTRVASANACVDVDDLDPGEASLRESLHYVEASVDPKRTCSGCAYFSAGGNDCGRCDIFHGAANPHGVCESWSARK